MRKREWSREDMKIANETEHTRKIEGNTDDTRKG